MNPSPATEFSSLAEQYSNLDASCLNDVDCDSLGSRCNQLGALKKAENDPEKRHLLYLRNLFANPADSLNAFVNNLVGEYTEVGGKNEIKKTEIRAINNGGDAVAGFRELAALCDKNSNRKMPGRIKPTNRKQAFINVFNRLFPDNLEPGKTLKKQLDDLANRHFDRLKSIESLEQFDSAVPTEQLLDVLQQSKNSSDSFYQWLDALTVEQCCQLKMLAGEETSLYKVMAVAIRYKEAEYNLEGAITPLRRENESTLLAIKERSEALNQRTAKINKMVHDVVLRVFPSIVASDSAANYLTPGTSAGDKVISMKTRVCQLLKIESCDGKVIDPLDFDKKIRDFVKRPVDAGETLTYQLAHEKRMVMMIAHQYLSDEPIVEENFVIQADYDETFRRSLSAAFFMAMDSRNKQSWLTRVTLLVSKKSRHEARLAWFESKKSSGEDLESGNAGLSKGQEKARELTSEISTLRGHNQQRNQTTARIDRSLRNGRQTIRRARASRSPNSKSASFLCNILSAIFKQLLRLISGGCCAQDDATKEASPAHVAANV